MVMCYFFLTSPALALFLVIVGSAKKCLSEFSS